MTDELRACLPAAFERLTSDLTTGTLDDPHAAFVVLVYPDREPRVMTVTPAGCHDVGSIVTSDDKNASHRKDKGRFWTFDDLRDARDAMSDTAQAIRGFGWVRKRDAETSLGVHVASEIRRTWQYRRDAQLTAAMEKAAHDARYAFKCEFCGSGYTERGLGMHQSRAMPCRRRLAEKLAADQADGAA